jgi:hypothetical protein
VFDVDSSSVHALSLKVTTAQGVQVLGQLRLPLLHNLQRGTTHSNDGKEQGLQKLHANSGEYRPERNERLSR